MIVTFHIAVQLVCYIWERVKLIIIPPPNSIEDSNDGNSDLSDTVQSENVNNDQNNEESLVEPQQSLLRRPRNLGISPTNKSAKVKEDVPEEDSDYFNAQFITDLSYDANPKFECICDEDGQNMRFIPPVYTQRYMVIGNILKEPCWAKTVKKIVDFGCAELKFESVYLKRLEGIEEIISVDIDEELLKYNSCRLMPSIPDYLQRRSSPLKVRIYCGNVANTNEILVGCDAVIAIELIEHLYPLDLEDLPFTVFGFIRPRIAIFTTPNADFNVLFTNFSGFRHSDHKFEWSRQEFEDWGNNLVMRYPDYSVMFQGVGPGPAGTEHLGCCSQMATFVKQYDSHSVSIDELHVQDGDYKLINEYDHPYDERTREEIIRDDAIAFIYKQKSLSRYYHGVILKEVSLKDVMQAAKCYNRLKLMNILIENKWQIGTNESGYDVVLLPDDESDDESNIEDEYYDQDQEAVLETCYSNVDENWDSDEKDCSTNDSLESSNDLGDRQVNKDTYHDLPLHGCSEQCLKPEGEKCLPADAVKDQSEISSEKESEKDCSIYETPYSNTFQIKSKNQLTNNPSNHSMYCKESNSVNGCVKALVFETSQNSNDSIGKTEPFCCVSNTTIVSNEIDRNESFCSLDSVNSPLNISAYATPCCSTHHNSCAQKSHSLEQLNVQCSSSFSTGLNCESRLPDVNCKQSIDVSKSMECFKTHDTCDNQETCSNVSKILDSGYPESCSEHNMELDLTVEQFDEIETESDENYDSSSPPVSPVQAQQVIDHVENGDVVNNNRDGEGNNVVADMEEDPLEFEAHIEEVNNMAPNFEGAHRLEVQEFIQYGSVSNSPGGGSSDMEEEHFEFESQIEEVKSDKGGDGQDALEFYECHSLVDEQDEKLPTIPDEEYLNVKETPFEVKSHSEDPSVLNISNLVPIEPESLMQQHLNSRSNPLKKEGSKSQELCIKDSKLSLNFASVSLCHLDSSEKTTNCCEHSITNSSSHESFNDHSHIENKANRSDNFVRNCSSQESFNKHNPISSKKPRNCYGNSVRNGLSQESSNELSPISSENTTNCSNNAVRNDSSQESCNEYSPILDGYSVHLPTEHLNTNSECVSTRSLQSDSGDLSFPTWLLDIQLSETEEYDLESRNSETTISANSFEDFSLLDHDEQFDAGAGGDQCSWH